VIWNDLNEEAMGDIQEVAQEIAEKIVIPDGKLLIIASSFSQQNSANDAQFNVLDLSTVEALGLQGAKFGQIDLLADGAVDLAGFREALTPPTDTTAPETPTLAQSGKTLTITGEAGATVKILDGTDTDVTNKFTVTESDGTYTAVAKDGEFAGSETLSLTAVLTDTSGNESGASSAVTGAIDTTAPVAPTLAQSGKTLTITGEAGTVRLTS
jgi:hypothetical protein